MASNPVVQFLTESAEKLKAALADALDSDGGKQSIDALEGLIINTVVRTILGQVPGGGLVSGRAAEFLTQHATDATNAALDRLKSLAATPEQIAQANQGDPNAPLLKMTSEQAVAAVAAAVTKP